MSFAFRKSKHSTILVKHDYVPEICHLLEVNINSSISPIVKLFYPQLSVILFCYSLLIYIAKMLLKLNNFICCIFLKSITHILSGVV